MTAEMIARSLTQAQRRALMSGHESLFGEQVILSSRLNWKVEQNLRGMGLAIAHDIFRSRLTPLGLSVRRILTSEESE